MRISDWSSDVCSSDLFPCAGQNHRCADHGRNASRIAHCLITGFRISIFVIAHIIYVEGFLLPIILAGSRSEEHTSELQSLMRCSYAVFCLRKKTPRKSDAATTTMKVQRRKHLT